MTRQTFVMARRLDGAGPRGRARDWARSDDRL